MKAGDTVKCLQNESCASGRIEDGSIYTVGHIHGTFVRLVEVPNTWWGIDHFSVVNRPEDLYPRETFDVCEKSGTVRAILGSRPSKFTSTTYLEFVKQTLDDMQTLIAAKNADYTNGAGPFANFEAAEEFGVDPFHGLMLRMNDKMQRVKSFCRQGHLQVKGEGVDDCFKDFIGYSLIALALLQERRAGNVQ